MSAAADALHDRLAGAYFRAYALHKDPRHLALANDLLQELQDRAEKDLPNHVLTQRIRRLHGQVLICTGNPAGRDEILKALDTIGGATGTEIRTTTDKELARLAADLCGDLTLIGEHGKAIALHENVLGREVGDFDRKARRIANFASSLNQRAVWHHARGKDDLARKDLDFAASRIKAALEMRQTNAHSIERDQALELRECRAIQVSIAIERASANPCDLSDEIEAMKALLRESADLSRHEDTPLQIAYRVGRLGVAHLRTTVHPQTEEEDGLKRAEAYLRFAWEYTRSVLLRPWVARDLCEALAKNRGLPDAAAMAEKALARLEPQCGKDYPVNVRLREYLRTHGSGSARPRGKKSLDS